MKRIKTALAIVVCFFITTSARSQTTAEDSIKLVIGRMYTAMRNSDGLNFQRCFIDSAKLQTLSRDKNGGVIIKTDFVGDFAQVINNIPKGAADQRISFDVVKINGTLAVAWVPYKFYANGQVYYCGVNSIQLIRVNGVWKILSTLETRNKDNCGT
jgi:hypothetical protein